MTDQPEVKPGQIWADNDKRSKGRLIRVVAVNGTRALVEDANTARAIPRQTRIRLDRFRPTSTGYRLVQDTPKETDR